MSLMQTVIRRVGSLHARLYRLTGGRGVGHLGDAPIAIVTTVGAKTGKKRTVPLLYLEDGASLVLVASNGGADQHPAWYHNLRARPRAKVQIGSETRNMHARDATPEEVATYWPRLVDIFSRYDTYREMTDRQIPLVILEPAEP